MTSIHLTCTNKYLRSSSHDNTSIGAEIYTGVPISSSSSAIQITGFIPEFPFAISDVTLFLKNPQGDRTTNSYDLLFYDIPQLYSISPNSAYSYGGFEVIINGYNFTQTAQISNIYCRFGGVQCTQTCTYISKSLIKCITPAIVPGQNYFQISYNKNDWYPLNFTEGPVFTTLACPLGYGALDYTTPCIQCPPGTYKNVIGSAPCFECVADTYNEV